MPSPYSPYSDRDSVRAAELLPIGDLMPALLAKYDLKRPADWPVMVCVDPTCSWHDEIAIGQAVPE